MKTFSNAALLFNPAGKRGTMGSWLPLRWRMGVSTLTGVGRSEGGYCLSSGTQVTMGRKPPSLCLECRAV